MKWLKENGRQPKPDDAKLPPLNAYAWSYEAAAIKPEPKIYQSLID